MIIIRANSRLVEITANAMCLKVNKGLTHRGICDKRRAVYPKPISINYTYFY